MLTAAEATVLAERVKRMTRNSDILDLCDLVLQRSTFASPPPAPPPPPRTLTEEQKRRNTETARERMRRMRAKQKEAANA